LIDLGPNEQVRVGTAHFLAWGSSKPAVPSAKITFEKPSGNLA
jgi:hypothetical protein